MWKSGLFFGPCIGKILTLTELHLLFVFHVITVCIGALCPLNIQKEAFTCISGYSTQLLSMTSSTETLFTGVDVELLRSFCSAYIMSMECAEDLKAKCPESLHEKIDNTLSHFDGAKDELNDLCKDDALYEVYARHMTCFLVSQGYSEKCFEDNMNSTVRLMGRFDDKSMSQLCSGFRLTLNCIRDNIEGRCGSEAGELVPVLVKPMVRRSSDCEINRDDAHLVWSTSTEAFTVDQTTSTIAENVITDSVKHRINVRHKIEDDTDDRSNSATSLSYCLILIAIIHILATCHNIPLD